jgi:hypothetical protein
MTIDDPTPVMYDETYFDKGDRKMHAVRHEEPFMKVGPHSARISGVPQRATEARSAEYSPLSVEGKLWDKKARDGFSAEAKELLLSKIRDGLHASQPPEHRVGQKSDCWGHAGCDYVYTAEEVGREHEARIKTGKDLDRFCRFVAP